MPVKRTRHAGLRSVGPRTASCCGLAGDPTISAGAPYVIVLDWNGERLSKIRDFRYGTYVMGALELGSA
ncbi:hypothetical protein [Trinickia sp.]|uniref:hypothetical protein n=1 Tax=Trinickia sp. TaxID=2571163 RepID=UPI003F814BAA